MGALAENIKWLAVQYKGTNIQALEAAKGGILETEMLTVLAQLPAESNVDTASGVWLDFIGYRYGVTERPGIQTTTQAFGFDPIGSPFNTLPFGSTAQGTTPMPDPEFRKLIKVKARQAVTDCSAKDIRDILLLVFENAVVSDAQNMNMFVTIDTSQLIEVVQAFVNAGVVTRPAAVGVTIVIVDGPVFGFAGVGSPFNTAPFARPIIEA